jgi:hypothetical protein
MQEDFPSSFSTRKRRKQISQVPCLNLKRTTTVKANAHYSNSAYRIDPGIKSLSMVQCPNCGAHIEEQVNHCNTCGALFQRNELCSKKQLVVGLSIWLAILMLTQIVTIILFGKPFYGGGQWGALYMLPAFFGTTWLSRCLALKFVKPLYILETMLTREEQQAMNEAYHKLTKSPDKEGAH